jgi:cysteine synthase A
MALGMIEGAERDGLLSAGHTVVEYTAAARARHSRSSAARRGTAPLIVMADRFTEERFQLLRALGAEVDVVPSMEGPR